MDSLTNVEFYNSPDGDVFMKRPNLPVIVFSNDDRKIIECMLVLINDRYPEAFARLSLIYSKYERNRLNYEFKMVHRFCRCNFGEYDQNQMDIDSTGRFNFEEVRCPLRGECPHECVICKPKLNTKLTERELEVMQYIAEGLQSQQIADELNISVCTINRHRENIKAKLSLKTIGEVVNYYLTNIK